LELKPEVFVLGLRVQPLLRMTQVSQTIKQPKDMILDDGISLRLFLFGGASLESRST
jgi:hypothetical protein